jgi:hypothetical protein
MNFNSKMIILKNKKLSWNNRMLEWLWNNLISQNIWIFVEALVIFYQ